MTPDAGNNRPRLAFLDRLKALLTVLVVFHHAAITYGAAGDWFYREQVMDGSWSNMLLTLFCAVNQSFFMGMFFLLAGYFTPGALQREGMCLFLQKRLLRLGVPALAFGLVVGPWTLSLAQGSGAADLGWRFVQGPLWFCWALLLFTAAYAWLHHRNLRVALEKPLRSSVLVASAIWVGLMAFGLRLVFPVGETVLGMQLGYFVSYGFLFMAGCAAARHRLLEQVSPRQARQLGVFSALAFPLLPAMWLLAPNLGMANNDFAGGVNVLALTYALWEPVLAWGIIASLLVWSRSRLSHPCPRWDLLSNNAFGAFVVHAPVLVLVSRWLASLDASPLGKFLLTAALATTLAFVLSHLLRLAPAVRRVL